MIFWIFASSPACEKEDQGQQRFNIGALLEILGNYIQGCHVGVMNIAMSS